MTILLRQAIAVICLATVSYHNVFKLLFVNKVNDECRGRAKMDPAVFFDEFAAEIIRINDFLQSVLDEPENIFDGKTTFDIAYFHLSLNGKTDVFIDDVQLTHLDALKLAFFSLDSGSNSTLVAHAFQKLSLTGRMTIGAPYFQSQRFVVEFAGGLLNVTRGHDRPYYDISVDLPETLSDRYHQSDITHLCTRVYVERVKAELLRRAAESFRAGFARNVDRQLRAVFDVVPGRLPVDCVRCECGGGDDGVQIVFPKIVVSELRQQLNNKPIDLVEYYDRGDHFVSRFSVAFDDVALNTVLDVQVGKTFRWARPVRFVIDRVQINVSYTMKSCPVATVRAQVNRLWFDEVGQFDRDVVKLVNVKLPDCIERVIENGIKSALISHTETNEKHSRPRSSLENPSELKRVVLDGRTKPVGE